MLLYQQIWILRMRMMRNKKPEADGRKSEISVPVVTVDGIDVWCRHDKLVDISKLKPHPKNPNQHTDEQIRILAKIITGNGWREVITVSTRSGYITKGHGRLRAAIEMGAKQAPVNYQNYPTIKAELEDLVADNTIAEMSWIDEDMLDEVMKDVEEINIDDIHIDLDFELFGLDKIEYTKKNQKEKKEKEKMIPDKDPNILVRLSFHPGLWLGKREEIKGVLNKFEKTYPCTIRIEE